MELKFKLIKSSQGYKLIKILTLIEREEFMVPNVLQLIDSNNYPNQFKDYYKEIIKSKCNPKRITFTKKLTENELRFFWNGSLQIDNVKLTKYSDHDRRTEKQKENALKRKLNQLKFNSKVDDVGQFRDQFLDCVKGYNEKDEASLKLYLMKFVNLEHHSEFEVYLESLNLEQFLNQFFIKYRNYNPINNLRSCTLKSLNNNVEQYVDNKFELLSLTYKYLSFKEILNQFIKIAEPEIQDLFKNDVFAKSAVTNKERCKDFIRIKLKLLPSNNDVNMEEPVNFYSKFNRPIIEQ